MGTKANLKTFAIGFLSFSWTSLGLIAYGLTGALIALGVLGVGFSLAAFLEATGRKNEGFPRIYRGGQVRWTGKSAEELFLKHTEHPDKTPFTQHESTKEKS